MCWEQMLEADGYHMCVFATRHGCDGNPVRRLLNGTKIKFAANVDRLFYRNPGLSLMSFLESGRNMTSLDKQQPDEECGSHYAEQGSIQPRSPSLHSEAPAALGANSESPQSVLDDKKKRPVDDIVWNVLQQNFQSLAKTMEKYILLHTNCKNSLDRQRQALELVQVQEDYLTDDQMVAFLDLFGNDPLSAEVYVAIKSESLRKAWVRLKLWKDLGFPKDQ